MTTPNTVSLKEKFNSFFVHQLFEDFDEWIEGFKTWHLTATQLSQGKFKGELAIAQLGCLQFIYASANQAMQIIGSKPPNSLTFATLLAYQDQELVAHNQRLNQKVLFGLDPTRETHLINQKSCKVGMIVVNTNLFHQYTDLINWKPFNDAFFQKNVVYIAPTQLSYFKTYLQQLFYLLQTNPTWLQQAQTQKIIVEDCLPLLIDTLRFDEDSSNSGIPKLGRYQMVKELEDFMIANIDQPLTLKDLYTAVKTSPRTLAYGVHDLFGMSPMEYLKIKRLNGVRRTLKTCDSNQTTISGIATHWGFWSMGHFSRDYKQLFGELPSETLKKAWESQSYSRRQEAGGSMREENT